MKTAVIETITRELEDKSDVRALLLSGSYGARIEDSYSDIDFLAVVSDGRADKFAAFWRKAVSLVGNIVLWRERKGGSVLINAITHDWLRIDVQVVSPDQMAGRARDGLQVLFDRDELWDALPDALLETGPNAERLGWQFEEFIRVLGLLSVAMGREEYFNAMTGVFHLRNLLVNLLVEETGAPHRGGALHLNRLITAEQKELLASLPPLTPTRDSMIAAHLAYAAAYLPRAREMAKRLEIDWPRRFEAATWDYLNRQLGVRPAYSLS